MRLQEGRARSPTPTCAMSALAAQAKPLRVPESADLRLPPLPGRRRAEPKWPPALAWPGRPEEGLV